MSPRFALVGLATAPLNNSRLNEWMDFFRRGCWLSGCDIETSAHGKAEWLQGFNAEELEAWNLQV